MSSIIKEYIPTNKDGHFFKCELYYDLGGWDYFNGGSIKRGYYVSVCPVERRTSDAGYTMESYTAFSGIRAQVVECDRQSKKRAAEAAERYEAIRDELMALPRFNEYRAKPAMKEAV